MNPEVTIFVIALDAADIIQTLTIGKDTYVGSRGDAQFAMNMYPSRPDKVFEVVITDITKEIKNERP